jgi:hypothetical protein
MAAGLGFKEFTTGDVLTAADANGYLASQVVMVFASAAARTSAVTSPQEGMISYLKDTNSTEYYSGSAWVAIGGAASTPGLELITTASFSAVSAVNLNNIFTSTYTNYRVQIIENGSANTAFSWRLRASGTDNTSSNYAWGINGMQYTGQSTYNESINGSLATSFKIGATGGAYQTNWSADIFNPQATATTTYNGIRLHPDVTSPNAYAYTSTGFTSVTTSYDGMSFFPGSGTTTGTYWIYGYKKA